MYELISHKFELNQAQKSPEKRIKRSPTSNVFPSERTKQRKVHVSGPVLSYHWFIDASFQLAMATPVIAGR